MGLLYDTKFMLFLWGTLVTNSNHSMKAEVSLTPRNQDESKAMTQLTLFGYAESQSIQRQLSGKSVSVSWHLIDDLEKCEGKKKSCTHVFHAKVMH